MKKKIIIIIGVIFLITLAVLGVLAKHVDTGRVETNNEPKYCMKIVSNGGNKVTYWGLGYKIIRYPAVSPNEPYANYLGVKMGSWFMRYELTGYDELEVELLTEGKTIKITRTRDIERIASLLKDSKYNKELCLGISTHKIKLGEDTYYILGGCKELLKGQKQASLTDNDFENLMDIITEYYKYNEYDKTYILYSDTADTEKLVRYNGYLYAKSYAIIDFSQKPNDYIGVIDKLIDSEYIPKYNGETNAKEILNAKVVSIGETTIVLHYNNNYVLFEKIKI